MEVHVISTIGALADDLARMPVKVTRELGVVVRSVAEEGSLLAREFAKSSAGKHGKLYPRTITAEKRGPLSWKYGPDAAMPQGGMSFEYGSRKQPPHLDLARSADIAGPAFAHEVGNALDRVFW